LRAKTSRGQVEAGRPPSSQQRAFCAVSVNYEACSTACFLINYIALHAAPPLKIIVYYFILCTHTAFQAGNIFYQAYRRLLLDSIFFHTAIEPFLTLTLGDTRWRHLNVVV
jgi:hypothetical protein